MRAKPRLHVDGNRHQTGFTLLEILAVIVIIGIIISFASLSLSSRALEDRLTSEADRLDALLSLAADEAIVQGEEIGLLVAADGYAFYHLDQNEWTPYEQGSLRERELPEGINLTLVADSSSEEVVIPLPGDQGKNPDRSEDALTPQILLLSSGELTPFVLQLYTEHLKAFYQAEGKITGQIEMKRIGGKST